MTSIVEEDVFFWEKNEWKRRYCVLNRFSRVANELNFYVYKDRRSYLEADTSSPHKFFSTSDNAGAGFVGGGGGGNANKVRGSSSSESCHNDTSFGLIDLLYGCVYGLTLHNKSWVILLVCKGGTHCIALPNLDSLTRWRDILRPVLKDESFHVALLEVSAHSRMPKNTHGFLLVQPGRICFFTEPIKKGKNIRDLVSPQSEYINIKNQNGYRNLQSQNSVNGKSNHSRLLMIWTWKDIEHLGCLTLENPKANNATTNQSPTPALTDELYHKLIKNKILLHEYREEKQWPFFCLFGNNDCKKARGMHIFICEKADELHRLISSHLYRSMPLPTTRSLVSKSTFESDNSKLSPQSPSPLSQRQQQQLPATHQQPQHLPPSQQQQQIYKIQPKNVDYFNLAHYCCDPLSSEQSSTACQCRNNSSSAAVVAFEQEIYLLDNIVSTFNPENMSTSGGGGCGHKEVDNSPSSTHSHSSSMSSSAMSSSSSSSSHHPFQYYICGTHSASQNSFSSSLPMLENDGCSSSQLDMINGCSSSQAQYDENSLCSSRTASTLTPVNGKSASSTTAATSDLDLPSSSSMQPPLPPIPTTAALSTDNEMNLSTYMCMSQSMSLNPSASSFTSTNNATSTYPRHSNMRLDSQIVNDSVAIPSIMTSSGHHHRIPLAPPQHHQQYPPYSTTTAAAHYQYYSDKDEQYSPSSSSSSTTTTAAAQQQLPATVKRHKSILRRMLSLGGSNSNNTRTEPPTDKRSRSIIGHIGTDQFDGFSSRDSTTTTLPKRLPNYPPPPPPLLQSTPSTIVGSPSTPLQQRSLPPTPSSEEQSPFSEQNIPMKTTNNDQVYVDFCKPMPLPMSISMIATDAGELSSLSSPSIKSGESLFKKIPPPLILDVASNVNELTDVLVPSTIYCTPPSSPSTVNHPTLLEALQQMSSEDSTTVTTTTTTSSSPTVLRTPRRNRAHSESTGHCGIPSDPPLRSITEEDQPDLTITNPQNPNDDDDDDSDDNHDYEDKDGDESTLSSTTVPQNLNRSSIGVVVVDRLSQSLNLSTTLRMQMQTSPSSSSTAAATGIGGIVAGEDHQTTVVCRTTPRYARSQSTSAADPCTTALDRAEHQENKSILSTTVSFANNNHGRGGGNHANNNIIIQQQRRRYNSHSKNMNYKPRSGGEYVEHSSLLASPASQISVESNSSSTSSSTNQGPKAESISSTPGMISGGGTTSSSTMTNRQETSDNVTFPCVTGSGELHLYANINDALQMSAFNNLNRTDSPKLQYAKVQLGGTEDGIRHFGGGGGGGYTSNSATMSLSGSPVATNNNNNNNNFKSHFSSKSQTMPQTSIMTSSSSCSTSAGSSFSSSPPRSHYVNYDNLMMDSNAAASSSLTLPPFTPFAPLQQPSSAASASSSSNGLGVGSSNNNNNNNTTGFRASYVTLDFNKMDALNSMLRPHQLQQQFAQAQQLQQQQQQQQHQMEKSMEPSSSPMSSTPVSRKKDGRQKQKEKSGGGAGSSSGSGGVVGVGLNDDNSGVSHSGSTSLSSRRNSFRDFVRRFKAI